MPIRSISSEIRGIAIETTLRMYYASVFKSKFPEASEHLFKEAPQSMVIAAVQVAAFDIERIRACLFDANFGFGYGKQF